MFNGYEMWKPDVDRCARYRITNMRGSACGRCMKTCPYNVEGVLSERPFQWAAMRLPFTRRWIAHLDDRLAMMTGSAGWGDAIVAVPWELYEAYGDREVLAENWPAMRRQPH